MAESDSDSDGCTLSVRDRAISTILTAFVGSIVTGVSDGPVVVFLIALLCWVAAVRIILVSVAGVLVNLFGSVHGIREPFIAVASPSESDGALPRTVTLTGPDDGRNANGNGNGNGVGSQSGNGGDGDGGRAEVFVSVPSFRRRSRPPGLVPSARDDGTAVDGAVGRRGFSPGETNASPASQFDARFRFQSSSPILDLEVDDSTPFRRSPMETIDLSSMTPKARGGETEDMNAPADQESATALGPLGSFQRTHDVTITGSMGWVYTFVYSPIIQVMWLVSNWSLAPPALLLARAVGLSVTALSYTVDTRARYAMAFGKKVGSKTVVPRLMTLYSASVNLLLSIVVVVLLIQGLVASTKSEAHLPPLWLALPYAFFSCAFAYKSFSILKPRDAGWSGASLKGSVTDVLKSLLIGIQAGAFTGVFVAAPAFVVLSDASFEKWGQDNGLPSDPRYTKGKNLGEWLTCSKDKFWKKAVQILP